ncbi:MAG: sugar kinase, partial [Synergistaceae bacterium]|nr:sugar kinase [Synergistaceae bacterium]
MYDIVTVGEILAEILTEHTNQEFTSPGILLGPYPSGAPAIAIDQAAKMGARTAIIARVGRDDLGKLNIDRLASDGVDVSHIVQTPENTTGVAFVTYFSDGSRRFVYHFTKAACGELSPADVDDAAVKDSRFLHIMGCSITGSPSLGASVMKAVGAAAQSGVKISFDPNIRPELLSGEIMTYYRRILDACDVLLTGRSEMTHLFGDADGAVKKLLDGKDRIVVVKDGSRGTSVYTREEAFRVPVYPADEVDPTGAGDSFDGTFLALLCKGENLRTAADFGNAAGALAVAKRGPMEGNSAPSEIEAFRAKSGA